MSVVDIEVFTCGKVKMISDDLNLKEKKVKVMISHLCVVDIKVFTYGKKKVLSDYLNLGESESDDLTFVRS